MTADGESPADHPDHATLDGCSDEPFVTDGALAPLIRIESLDQCIDRCLGKLEQTPYLHQDDARVFLEKVAYLWLDVKTEAATMVDLVGLIESVAESGQPDWPPELGDAERGAIITQLFSGSVSPFTKDADLRFACTTAHEYLAACYIFQRYPHGWRRRRHVRKHLKPSTILVEFSQGVMQSLAALWWRVAKSDVAESLSCLLVDQHCDDLENMNIIFIAKLIQRDVLPESDIRDRTVKFLCKRFTEGRGNANWMKNFELLKKKPLDLEMTSLIALLESVIQYPGRLITPQRGFLAVSELKNHDSARGAKDSARSTRYLKILVNKLTDSPPTWWNSEDRFETVDLITLRLDSGLGMQAMLQLAKDFSMGELRVDAAIYVGSLPRMCELIEREHTISDNGRLRLADKLLELNPIMAVQAMERFAETASEEDTPLRIAEKVWPEDRDVALRIATKVAWPANPEINSSVRLDAVILIGKIDPGQAISKLQLLSADPSVTDEFRWRAATLSIKHGGPITALVNFGDDPKVDYTYRVKAAEQVGKSDPGIGARLYISITKTLNSTDPGWLTLLKKAYLLDPKQTAEALAKVAETETARIPGSMRLEAFKIAERTLGKKRTIDVYTTIATTSDDETALDAAREVMAIDPDDGRQLMANLALTKQSKAKQNKMDIRFQLTAAREAGRYGIPILKTLADTARLDTDRLEAAKTLCAIDLEEGESALWRLVKKPRGGNVRIDAALTLSETSVVDALIIITKDSKEEEAICFDAGVKAMEKDEERGRQALRDFDERGISEKTRRKLHRHLKT